LFTMTLDLNYACVHCLCKTLTKSVSNLICIRNHIHWSVVEMHQGIVYRLGQWIRHSGNFRTIHIGTIPACRFFPV